MITVERLKQALEKHPEIKIQTGSMYDKFDGVECCCAMGIVYLDKAKESISDENLSEKIWDIVEAVEGEKYVVTFYAAFDGLRYYDAEYKYEQGYKDGLACRQYCIEQGLL